MHAGSGPGDFRQNRVGTVRVEMGNVNKSCWISQYCTGLIQFKNKMRRSRNLVRIISTTSMKSGVIKINQQIEQNLC